MTRDPDDTLDPELLAAWAEASLVSEAPPSGARARLLEALGGIDRFRLLLDALGRLTDLGAEALAAVLRQIDDDAAWIDGSAGVQYFHFTPGPGAPTPQAGIVRLRPGAVFPRHRHLAREVSFVLDGVLIEDGRRHGPGAVVESAAGSEHAYAAGEGRDLLLVAMHGGIAFVDPAAFRLAPRD